MDNLPQRKNLFLIQDLETLRVLSDPLRSQILVLLDNKPQTVNEIAEKLGMPSSRLYYHFNQLEAHGLIAVVNTRVVNNMIEKIYWLTAEELDIDKTLLDFSSDDGQENLSRFVSSSLEATRTGILRAIQVRKLKLEHGEKALPRDMLIVQMHKRIKDKDYQAFVVRLQDLLDEFSDLPEEEAEGEEVNDFSLACYVYPSYYYENHHPSEDEGDV